MPNLPLTTKQVAATFGVDISTVSRWVQMGHLPAERFGVGRTALYAFDPDDVTAFGDALRSIDAGRAA